MNKIFLIEHSVFDSQTAVAIGVSDKKLLKWINENTLLECDSEMKSIVKLSGNAKTVINPPFTLIRFKEWKGSNYDLSVLAHEAFHLAELILDRVGVKYDVDKSGEVYAYFIQSTVKQFLDEVGEA